MVVSVIIVFFFVLFCCQVHLLQLDVFWFSLSPNEDISCISNPSQSNDISSVLGNGERKKLADFGLLDDTNDGEYV